MDLLRVYSSDDSSSETTSHSQQNTAKKQDLGCVTIVSLQGSKTTTFQRNVPHIRGNWSGHVFSEFNEDQANWLDECAEESIERFRCALERSGWSGDVMSHLCSGLHISFTRPFFLQLASVQSFHDDLKDVLVYEHACSLSVETEIVLSNEEGTRSFFGWKLADNQWLKTITNHVDTVMAKYNQRKYYNPPIFHVSIASVSGAVPDEVQTILDNFEDSLVLASALKIQTIYCTFGTTKHFSFTLL
mmetsp:Transcript_8315/g.12805  ORF Transcript_8315/g.12805 Transcript_8315/m.12805 type:complete len:245 (-) Transcript_8315:218-952(-)